MGILSTPGGPQLSLDDLRAITAEWIRSGLDQHRLTPEALADHSGVAKSTIYRLLKAEVTVEEATLVALSKALKMPFPRLVMAPDANPIKSDRTGPGRPQAARSPDGLSRVSSSDREAGAAAATATDEDVQMLAQRMTQHWHRIAQTRELTGPSLIPLLEEEARWFRGQGYMECYDATLDLIREIRWIEKKRDNA